MAAESKIAEPDGTGLIALDPWLEPYAEALRHRYRRFRARLDEIVRTEGSLEAFSRGYRRFGFNRGRKDGRPGVWYREWAPGAEQLFLIGDFNGWNRSSHPMERDQFGVWRTFVPDDEGGRGLRHGDHVKVHVISRIGPMDRIPAYIRRVVYDPTTHNGTGQYWDPPEPYRWRYPVPALQGHPRIYEAHVGMALEAERIGTYNEFTDQILPRIVAAGYNVVQLMAVQEHPYYASFGYHVNAFYAVSSRFGTPEDLKRLIDTAHGRGLLVFLDLVHSHAVKNVQDGLNMFDGTDHQYFHAGPRGQHPAWDSLLFDYGKWEVLRFLLSNVRFWIEEYHFDGLRFDGVTSMMYLHHGLGKPFTCYDDYLIHDIDEDAVTCLQLANMVAHEAAPHIVTIAEDVSGMVGLARPLEEGGLGFDYRLAMGVPDYWIRLLRERKDEDWHMDEMYHTLVNRRPGEKHVAYAECHDQALVGDKTIAFWLMDASMYWYMSKEHQDVVIDRGIALHKMIRLITFSLAGEAWLNFMGNEFGHPEWIDFPREGNGFSFKYARRQWSLVDNLLLRYRDLAAFDREMQALDVHFGLLGAGPIEKIKVHEDNKILAYRRGPLVFIFNFHPHNSYPDFTVGVPSARDYRVVMNTDDFWFGGHGIVPPGQVYPWQPIAADGRPQSVIVYIPARSAQVLEPM